MLVLSRKVGEVIHIGGGITVEVLDIMGNRIRLGITAPRDMPVYRKEVYDRIQEENAQNTNREVV